MKDSNPMRQNGVEPLARRDPIRIFSTSRQLSAAILMLSCLALVAPSVPAATAYCDNDNRNGSDPNKNCRNFSGGPWSYGHWRGDWHLDDRRNSSYGWYEWEFNNIRAYSLSVWLANYKFTDTKAAYYDTEGGVSWLLRYINQKTAPGGWHTLGYRRTQNVWVAHGNGVTGADAIRGVYSTTVSTIDGSDPAPSTAPPDMAAPGRCGKKAAVDPRIAAIQEKMLNAADHYQDVKGSFRVSFGSAGQDEDVDFEVSPRSASSAVRITRASGEVAEHRTNGQSMIALYPGRSAYEEGLFAEAERPQGPRHYLNDQCQPVYVYRQDSARDGAAGEVTSPENYAFWLSTSKSRIVGHEKLLERDATVISGRHDAYLGKKLRASAFRMWVDDETGVLLKLQGTDKAGKVAYAIDVRDIQFDTGMDLNPAIAAPADWKSLNPDR